MIRNLKLTMFIAHLPLSGFLCFYGKRYNLQKLSHLRIMLCFVMCIVVAASQFLNPPQAECAFLENLAIDTRAISLANNVTADPPGIMSVHFNPAGLSLMGDGIFITMGVTPVIINKTSKVSKDPNFDGFHDLNGNLIEDPLWGTRDGPYRFSGNSWSGTEQSNTSGRMYLPVLDTAMDFLIAPTIGFSSRQPGSKWTFGYGLYVPYGGGWRGGDENDPSHWGGQAVTLQHLIYAGPAVSYQVSKTFSIGASFGLGQSQLGATTNARESNELLNLTKVLGDATKDMGNPIFDLTIPMPLFGGGIGPYDDIANLSFSVHDDFSPSYNLGVLWGPFDWLSFGISYQSAIKSHLSGKYEWQYSEQWQSMVGWLGKSALLQIMSMALDLPYQATSSQSGTMTTDLEFPQIVNFGIKLKPIKRLSLLADLHWANWSSTKQNDFVFDQKIQILQLAKFMGYTGGAYDVILQRDLKDTLNWGVGAEYQLLDWLALRAGYENRIGSTQDIFYDTLYALPTVDYYGAGLGIKGSVLEIKMLKDVDVDIAVGYLVSKSYKVSDNTSTNMNSTVLGSGLLNTFAGMNYEQETNIYLGSVKATMPLNVVTDLVFQSIDLVNPFKRSSAKGSLRTTKGTVDSSSTVDTLRVEGQSYYTEDSE